MNAPQSASGENRFQELRHRESDIVWVREMAHRSNIFIRDNSGNLIEVVQEKEALRNLLDTQDRVIMRIQIKETDLRACNFT